MSENASHRLRNQQSALDWIDESLTELDVTHLRRRLVNRANRQGPQVSIEGQQLTNFASNDYLGLAADARLAMAALAAVEHFGWGGGASPLITGHSTFHQELESKLAKFEDSEAALLFPTGYAANVGTITALVGKHDLVFSDAKNHASIIDGCRLSGAQTHIYRHGDIGHLREQLRQASGDGKKLIVTDGLFSMDGDVAPLSGLVSLANEFGAMLMVDEAHATGVLGANGRGVSELAAVESAVTVRVGTLSKSMGTFGGFVAGDRKLIDWLINRSRPYVFSTAAPPAVVATGLAALEIIETEPERRANVLQLAAYLRERLRDSNFNVGSSTTQIVPVILGDPKRTMELSAKLRQQGVLVPAIRPPSVPEGESLLRISVSADHTKTMIDELVDHLIKSRNLLDRKPK